MYEHEFTGRCPSLTQIKAQVKKAMAAGHDWIQLSWGENQLTIEKTFGHGWSGPWFGHGWIGRASGNDIAQDLS
jgi:hypothetical protein